MVETTQYIYSLLSQPYALLALAFMLDLLIGDPRWLPHPVRGMGWAIKGSETFLRNSMKNKERLAGIFLVLIMICSTFGLFYLISFVFSTIHYSLFTSLAMPLMMVYLISTTIATKELIGYACRILWELKNKDIENARRTLSNIVGRDTSALDERGVIRATIESLAENASDGIIAPLFYFAIGGLPLAMTYKAINTMDSMVGYKNERYRCFGWAAARLDDIANYIPARITGLLIAVSSFVVHHSLSTVHYSLKTMFRDGGNHPSPNSGVPEAAISGALGIKLGGPSTYGGVYVEKPYIGENSTEDYLSASDRAIEIVKITSLLGVASAIVVIYARSAI